MHTFIFLLFVSKRTTCQEMNLQAWSPLDLQDDRLPLPPTCRRPWGSFCCPACGSSFFVIFNFKCTQKGETQCCGPDPGSGAFLTPGSPYFWRFSDHFLGKNFNKSLKMGPNFSIHYFKNKILFNFVTFVATKKGMTTNFFHPSLLLLFLDLGSGIRDPGSRIKDPGWVKNRVRDPG